MTLEQIEALLKEIQKKVDENTSAITILSDAMKNYVTTDDLTAISKSVNALQNDNTTLQNDVAALQDSVKKINFLSKLMDVSIMNLTEGDLLQYGHDGHWYNIQPSALGIVTAAGGGSSTLQGLSDVLVVGPTDGQVLTYDSSLSKWKNADIKISEDNTKYLTEDAADKLYLKITGGEIDWLTVNGFTTINDNLLVKGGITMYDE